MRLAVITDVHLAPVGTPPITWHSELKFADAGDRYSRALEAADLSEPDAIVVLGDLTHFGDVDSMDEFLERSNAAHAPVLAITGNHDVVPDPAVLGQEISAHGSRVRRVDGVTTSLHGVEVHGVGVRPVVAEAAGGGLFQTSGAPRLAGAGVVLTHFPIVSLEERCRRERIRYAGDLVDRADVEADLRAIGQPVVILTGHLHLRAVEASGALLQYTFGALIEAPFDVAVVDLELAADSGRVRVEQLVPSSPCPVALAGPVVTATFDGAGWQVTG